MRHAKLLWCPTCSVPSGCVYLKGPGSCPRSKHPRLENMIPVDSPQDIEQHLSMLDTRRSFNNPPFCNRRSVRHQPSHLHLAVANPSCVLGRWAGGWASRETGCMAGCCLVDRFLQVSVVFGLVRRLLCWLPCCLAASSLDGLIGWKLPCVPHRLLVGLVHQQADWPVGFGRGDWSTGQETTLSHVERWRGQRRGDEGKGSVAKTPRDCPTDVLKGSGSLCLSTPPLVG